MQKWTIGDNTSGAGRLGLQWTEGHPAGANKDEMLADWRDCADVRFQCSY